MGNAILEEILNKYFKSKNIISYSLCLQWQSCAKSMAYLFYRWFMALFFVGVVIVSMWPDPNDEYSYWLYLIYMTNWGIWMCMMTNLMGAILVTIWHYHPEYAGKISIISLKQFE